MRRSILVILVLPSTGCGAAPLGPPTVVLPPACGVGESCGSHNALVWSDSNAIPAYPPVLKAAGVEGEVAVRFAVSEEGVVDSSSMVIDKSTNKAFVPATLKALSKWRLTARSGQRQPRPTPFSITVHYTIGGECDGQGGPTRSAWSTVSSTSTLTVTACHPRLVPRDQVARNRAAAGMPPLDPPQ